MRKKIYFFVSGTDTGVGKTLITGLLARYFRENKFNVITQKWVETGAGRGNCSNDILEHIKLSGASFDLYKSFLEWMSPYLLKYPASPHLSAKLENKNISVKKIERAFNILKENFDVVICEGAGGLFVPINKKYMMIDICGKLGIPVLLVSENRLGAINQTILSIEALRTRKIPILGIILNQVDKKQKELVLKNNPRVIKELGRAVILGSLPYSSDKKILYPLFSRSRIGDSIIKEYRKIYGNR
ncbi:dethiobiotin synthase [Candidatus Omnitrophus magneticus]|uniref:ATP-dependent dethiobiotin synthetase BioD n=1 Tax=Candidatus Omnitrophus magneticus TaxID=1609969 RepID=A0A0F0CN52_9BACT|nr:dethiobiotin synthase [Candidatus Omnitrophus magneticus]